MTIENIADAELGSSVRTKLNRSLNRVVDTVADMLALTPTDGDYCQTLGYTTLGDEGANLATFLIQNIATIITRSILMWSTQLEKQGK